MIRELPTLKEVLASYSKQDLWDRIQQKNQLIKDLQHQLTVKDRALEMACKEELRGVGVYDEDYGSPEKLTTLIEDYLEQAEKELEDE